MNELAQLHSEYERLRNEIVDSESRCYQILGIMIAGSAALLATAIGKESNVPSLAALAVYAVTIPGYGMLRTNRIRIWRISTYMRVFLEPKLKFTQWETRLNAQREKVSEVQPQILSSLAHTIEWLAVSLLNLAAAVCGGFGQYLTAILTYGGQL